MPGLIQSFSSQFDRRFSSVAGGILGLLDEFGGASAAFSLRDLSGSTGSVVRVRRASDNAEKDFPAAAIASGDLVNWVNGQVVPPLDIRELDSNGERTGSLVAAAAAYSLRNLSTSYTGDVVNARRNTDGATLDFSAAEVADGTLTNWVNTSFANALPLDTASGAAAAYSLRNLSTSYTGNVVDVRRSSDDTEDSFTAAEVADGTLTTWVGAGNDGFVTQWYDQSGNANHATQGTDASQPKIVDAGVFLGQVDFLDGVNTFLETNNSDLANLSELSLFGVLEPVTASANEFAISAGSIVNSTGNYGGWALWANGYSDRLDFATQARGSGTNSLAQANITSTSPVVYSATLNGTNGQGAVNGALGTENTSMITPNNTDTTRRKLRLGCQYTFTPASFYRGAIKEVIIYNSDQSDKRQAIEENIGSNYGITLTSSKDGTVSTWYDQSGNANHATQTDAASQPKIVDAGSLLNKLKFEGAQVLQRIFTSPLSQPNSSFVVAQIDAGTGNNKIFDGFGGSSRNLMFAPNGSDFAMFAGSTVKYADRDANENLHTGIFNEDSSLGALNGVATSISGLGSQVAGGITIGRTHSVATGFLTGTVSELIFYASDQTDNRTAIEANIGETYNIDLPSGVDTGYDQVDGLVETWYDQSGNGNDAVQQVSASQPKIVDAGVLVSGGLEFDGVDDILQGSHFLDTDDVLYAAVVANNRDTSSRSRYVANIFYNSAVDNAGFALEVQTFGQSGKIAGYLDDTNASVSTQTGASSITENQTHLLSLDLSSGSSKFRLDGSLISTFTTTMSSEDSGNGSVIGNNGAGIAGVDGTIQEIIIYNSDQSANRAAIETNINNQYDIY